MYVIGARPSCGKTTMALCWIQRHIEMVPMLTGQGFWDYPRRLLAVLTERPPIAARRSLVATQLGYQPDLVLRERWDLLPIGAETHVAEGLKVIQEVEQNGWLRLVDAAGPTIEVLASEIEAFQPNVIWLDYIQRIRPTGRQSRFDAVGEAVHYFQALAHEADAIVMIASQLKRRGDGVFDKYRPPFLEDFKLSGEIEELADVALGLFRPLRRLTAEEERAVRNGERGLEDFTMPEAMAIKVVKHRYWGDAADQIARLRCRQGVITDWDGVPLPVQAEESWEAPF